MEEEEALLGAESVDSTALPFYMSLRDPLTVGNAIIVKGQVLENATTFAVNFCSTISCCLFRYNSGKDIAFSLRPYFDRRCVVRNSTHKLKWQTEEVAGNRDFPLSRKDDFCIEIFIAAKEFFVAINGLHFCTFLLRTALSSINSIEVQGDIKIDGVSINSSQEVYPSQSITRVQTAPNAFHVVNFDSNSFNCRDSKLPLIFALSKTLQSGNIIKIEGRVKMLPYSFLINLQNSESRLPHPNIQLHVNGRYNYSQKKSTKNLLVLNSWINEAWGTEKTLTSGSLPMPGNDFVITINCKEDHFKVHTHEYMALDFPYRSPLQDVKFIHIQGDIFVHSVTFS